MISVVTPWRTLLSAFGLIGRVKSECVLMSIKPGATASPAASMIFRAPSAICGPIAAMRPSAMARSAATPGLPVPSYKIPPRIRMSCIMLPPPPAGGRTPHEVRRVGGSAPPRRRPHPAASRPTPSPCRGGRNRSRLHAQRQGRSGGARAGGGFDAAVPGDGDGDAGAGHRDQFFFRAAAQIAIAALAATVLAQRVQAARAGGAGRTSGPDRPGLAFDALRPLRPGIALRPGRALRAVETAGERERRDESDNCQ